MQLQPDVFLVRILIQVINPVGIEKGRPALDTVHFIAFFQQQFSQVCPVLACDSCNQRAFRSHFFECN